jgi:transposase InsO family protein
MSEETTVAVEATVREQEIFSGGESADRLGRSTRGRKDCGAEKYQHPTKHVHELWQTDFTYFKIQRWGWYYLSTVLDDFSRPPLAWTRRWWNIVPDCYLTMVPVMSPESCDPFLSTGTLSILALHPTIL